MEKYAAKITAFFAWLLPRVFGSEALLRNIYRFSRPKDLERGARDRLSLSLCVFIVGILAIFLLSLTMRGRTVAEYLADQKDLVFLNDAATYSLLPLGASCVDSVSCYGSASQSADFAPIDAETSDARFEELDGESYILRVRFDLTNTNVTWRDSTSVVTFPSIRFSKAEIFLNDRMERTYFDSERLELRVPTTALQTSSVQFDILFRAKSGDRVLRWRYPILAASAKTHAGYVRFQEEQRISPRSQVGIIARVVLAVFALLLFLIIDSSPESLGLALFMGFDALGMSLSYADLRRLWVPEGWNVAGFEHYCHAMGDVFRLYFFLQLARVARPSITLWLAVGSLYALPYGYLRHISFDPGFNWTYYVIGSRDVFVALVGTIVCSRMAFHLRNKGVPWRVAALSLAAIGSVAQWLWWADDYFVWIKDIAALTGGHYDSFVSMLNANSAYLFALSAFINISTLENRVKVLSKEKVRADAIQRDLELGRSVQQAFLELPKMPRQIGLSCHHEAAIFVSGDTYFVHWDKNSETLCFLLNDVTGHGIQAALKAFACNIIARSVWSDETVQGDRRKMDHRLQKYDDVVSDLICRDGEVPDFNAMVGAEFNLQSGVVRLYRVNYNFPIVIEPQFAFGKEEPLTQLGAHWRARQLPIANRSLFEVQLKEGAFIMLVSDGLVETGRDQRGFVNYLNRVLANADDRIDANFIRHKSLCWEGLAKDRRSDDRTLLAFQWNPYIDAQEGRLKNDDELQSAS